MSSDQIEFDVTNSSTGFVGGGFLAIGLGDNFALQPELLYAQKGFGVDFMGASLDADLSYIEIPLLLKFRIGSADQKVRPALFVGGFYAFETGCSVSAGIGELDADLSCDTELDERSSTDAGILFGGGLDIAADRLFVVLDARYGLGLTNIDDDGGSDSVKSRTWSVSGGLGIPIG